MPTWRRPGPRWRTSRAGSRRNGALHGIRLIPLALGNIHTEGLEGYGDDIEAMAADVPLGRLRTPEEAAVTTTFLASSVAGYVSGTTVTIDGGLDATYDDRPSRMGSKSPGEAGASGDSAAPSANVSWRPVAEGSRAAQRCRSVEATANPDGCD